MVIAASQCFTYTIHVNDAVRDMITLCILKHYVCVVIMYIQDWMKSIEESGSVRP